MTDDAAEALTAALTTLETNEEARQRLAEVISLTIREVLNQYRAEYRADPPAIGIPWADFEAHCDRLRDRAWKAVLAAHGRTVPPSTDGSDEEPPR